MMLVKRYTVAVVCCAGLIGAGPAWAAKDTFTAVPVDDRASTTGDSWSDRRPGVLT